MIFTRSTGYALLALVELANSNQAIDTTHLSEKIGISRAFLAKILQNLSKKEIVKSFKGVKGGFILNKNPTEIKIVDVFSAVEDRDLLVFECSKDKKECSNKKGDVCKIWPFLNKLEIDIYEYLKKFTLEDILRIYNC